MGVVACQGGWLTVVDTDAGGWDTAQRIAMLERCDDDVAALLMAIKAFTPAEVRDMAPALGVPDVDDLRELTLTVVIAARRMDSRAEEVIRAWSVAWSRNPRDTTRRYLEFKRRRERSSMTKSPDVQGPHSTWTFFGHWDNDKIVVEYVLPGEVEDHRVDTGAWPEGLWAASGSGTTQKEAMASVIAEYEQR